MLGGCGTQVVTAGPYQSSLPAHLLSPHRPRLPIRPLQRTFVRSGKPETLLTQFDKPQGSWPALGELPRFPPEYPPSLVAFNDLALFSQAFNPSCNGRLEWLGDSVIAAAIGLSTHRLLTDPNTPVAPNTIEELGSRTRLAHLALLFELHIQDRESAEPDTQDTPGMESMCDLFEAFIGAVAIDTGLEYTLRWTAKLFDPWVAQYQAKHAVTSSAKIQHRYKSFIRYLHGAPIAPLRFNGINTEALDFFGPRRGSWNGVRLRVHEVMSSERPMWPKVDVSKVDLGIPNCYPPRPPAFREKDAQDAQVLTDALTHTFCHLHFGTEIVGNERYRWLGNRLCGLALSWIAYDKLASARVAELDDLRIECMDTSLLARLGAIIMLDEHLRILRQVGDEGTYVMYSQCADAFCAFVAAVYLRFGWIKLLDWLRPFWSPWIMSAANGDLRVSRGAEKQREERARVARRLHTSDRKDLTPGSAGGVTRTNKRDRRRRGLFDREDRSRG